MKTGKRRGIISVIAIIAFLIFGVKTVYAEDVQQQKKDVKKNISKEVKCLEKKGYVVPNGKLSLEKQIENLWAKQSEVDDKGAPVYYIITQKAIDESYPMASTKAHGLVRDLLLVQAQADILKMVNDKVAKNELGQERASEIASLMNANEYIIKATLGQTMPVVQVYKNLPENKVEVMLSFAYNNRMVTNAAIRAVRDNLGDSSVELAVELDKLMK